ncbi:MAG: nucleoside recognition domain-containing protein [Thermodesulfobacteriota bacterium]
MDLRASVKKCFLDAGRTCLELFKIMIPIVIGVKVLQELGLIKYLAVPLAPLMELVGLPAQTGLVWATAILNNLYAGIIVYLALLPDLPPPTVAQVTVLCTMMLIAHNLLVEARIVQKCGVSFWGQFLLRLLGALACGVCLHLVFSRFHLLAGPGRVLWRPEAGETSLWAWTLGQLQNLVAIFVIILLLMSLMRALNHFKITNVFIRVLQPVLKVMGIGRPAAVITIIGLTMGIAYGGGLIIHEVRHGHLEKRDVFAAASLMGLSHALIEDTLLMTMLGASPWGILWGRLAFSMVVVAALTRLAGGRPEPE